VTFGTVVSRGRAAGSSERLWGVRVALAPTVHGLWLDPLPGSWQQRCDLAQVRACVDERARGLLWCAAHMPGAGTSHSGLSSTQWARS
jgi:hypothetical protein